MGKFYDNRRPRRRTVNGIPHVIYPRQYPETRSKGRLGRSLGWAWQDGRKRRSRPQGAGVPQGDEVLTAALLAALGLPAAEALLRANHTAIQALSPLPLPVEAGDVLLARAGDPRAALAVKAWVHDRVRHEFEQRRGARGLPSLTWTTRRKPICREAEADIYHELITGSPLASRADMARRTGVAKGTYLRFRKRVFDIMQNQINEYARAAMILAKIEPEDL